MILCVIKEHEEANPVEIVMVHQLADLQTVVEAQTCFQLIQWNPIGLKYGTSTYVPSVLKNVATLYDKESPLKLFVHAYNLSPNKLQSF